MPELVFFRRGEEVLRFGFERPRVVLGRGEQSDVVLPDPEVSRSQVALVLEEGRVTAVDLSGRGTVIGGERRQSVELKDGADLVLGQWRAVYRERAAPAHAAATTGAREARTELVADGDLKKALFEHYWNYFAEPRKKRAELAANLDFVNKVLNDGAQKARTLARKVLDRAKKASGLD